MKTIIVMPAYNEEKRIGKTLEAFGSFYHERNKKSKDKTTILVVINNTTDKTEDIVLRARKKYSFISYLRLTKGGKGYAVIEGFKEALTKKVDYVGFVDADLATEPRAFCDLQEHIGNNEGIIASRYVSGAIISPPPSLQRWFASRLYNTLIRVLFMMPYRDTQCGAKLFRAEAIRKVLPSLRIASWSFDVELLFAIHKGGRHVIEFPTVWGDKHYSKVNFIKDGITMALQMILLRLNMKENDGRK